MSGTYVILVEPNRVKARTIVVIGIVSVVIILVSAWWVERDLPGRRSVYAGIRGTAPEDLHMVFQTLIDADHTTDHLNASKEARMREYGWVDRDRQIVRIPIERAMQLVVEGRR